MHDERPRSIVLPPNAVARDFDAVERTKCQSGKFERRPVLAGDEQPVDVRFDGT
jgi:hypothetical protein